MVCISAKMKLHYDLSEIGNVDLTPFIPIIVISYVIALVALIDLFVNRKTRKNVLGWVVIILVTNVIGSVLYFSLGRKD